MEQACITKKTVLNWLDTHDVPYEIYDHKRTHTIDACLEMPFITHEVTICKNIFLSNRQHTSFFLLLLKPHTVFKTAVISKKLYSSRLSFAPEEALESMLHVSGGSVSPLGLIFDSGHRITLCYEQDVLQTKKIAFHPCDNTATVIFEQSVFWDNVINALDIKPLCITLGEND